MALTLSLAPWIRYVHTAEVRKMNHVIEPLVRTQYFEFSNRI